jgi:hypothetical protein
MGSLISDATIAMATKAVTWRALPCELVDLNLSLTLLALNAMRLIRPLLRMLSSEMLRSPKLDDEWPNDRSDENHEPPRCCEFKD